MAVEFSSFIQASPQYIMSLENLRCCLHIVHIENKHLKYINVWQSMTRQQRL